MWSGGRGSCRAATATARQEPRLPGSLALAPALILAEVELLQHVAPQRIAGEALAAVGAEIEPQLLVGILVFFRLRLRLLSLQRFVNLQQSVPVVVPLLRLR